MMPKLPSLATPAPRSTPDRLILIGALALAAFVRIIYLGDRSLWLDELSTWHVSRMPLIESLTWPAEYGPPLYALCVRVCGGGTHPPEWLLRLPAALAGVLTVFGVWRLMRLAGAGSVTVTVALLLSATHVLLIDYSREARPYSFLVLFLTLAMCAALRLARERTAAAAWEWLAWAGLALYSHTFAAFSLLACGAFWFWVWRQDRDRRIVRFAGLALIGVVVLAVPLAARSWHFRVAIQEGLRWVDPPSLASISHVITAIAPGGSARSEDLIAGLIGLGIVCAAMLAGLVLGGRRTERGAAREDSDVQTLLAMWLGLSLALPLLMTLLGRSLLVPRYVITAALPLLLWSLLLLSRVSPRAVAGAGLVLLTLQALGARRVMDMPPAGLRELVGFLDVSVQPDRDAIVLCMHATHEAHAEAERLALRYYRPKVGTFAELHLNVPNHPSNEILRDPRRLYLIVFQGDPLRTIEAAGRETEPFIDDPQLPQPLSALLFEPYRLIKVAPRRPTASGV